MRIRFLLDTNVISEPHRVRPNPGVMRKIGRHAGEIALSAPGWQELIFGWKKLDDSIKRSHLGRYLRKVRLSTPILPYDHRAAVWQGEERARLYKEGLTLSPKADPFIAAVAQVNDLVLVTHNTLDFAVFEGLRIEDWMA